MARVLAAPGVHAAIVPISNERVTLLKAKPVDRMTTEPAPPTWGKPPRR